MLLGADTVASTENEDNASVVVSQTGGTGSVPSTSSQDDTDVVPPSRARRAGVVINERPYRYLYRRGQFDSDLTVNGRQIAYSCGALRSAANPVSIVMST